MQERFETSLLNELGINKTDRIICAVSGGGDSMAMLHLFKSINMSIVVAHCNFKLRGKESEDDEKFVKNVCLINDVPFYSKSFNTESIAKKNGLSIQQTARDLRYEWFEELRLKLDYTFIATAHNLTDNLETVLINQIRGTDIYGYKGIPLIRGKIIRPMMIFKSSEIRAFNQTQRVKYRNDSSNSSDKYLRNNIRHNVFKDLIAIEPDIEQRFADNSTRVSETISLHNALINRKLEEIVVKKNGDYYLPISAISSFPHYHKILYCFVGNFGFTEAQIRDFSYSSTVGSFSKSETHHIIRDRHNFIVSKTKSTTQISISGPGVYQFNDFEIIVEHIEETPSSLILPKSACYVDSQSLKLVLRNWLEGDKISPIGMKGTKLLSDVFINRKTPRNIKHSLPILVNHDEVVWVPNHSFSKRYALREDTDFSKSLIWRITLLENVTSL